MTNEEAIDYIEKWKTDYSVDAKDREVLSMAIKALEQQTCDDCISREALRNLKVSVPIAPVFIDDNHIKYRDAVFYDDIIDLPSVTPKTEWIPVSERLPEKTSYYLVTLDHGTWGLATVQGEFDAINNRWNYDRVIAWMSFPEPYKAESEE